MTFFLINQYVSMKGASEWTAYIQQLGGTKNPYASTQRLMENSLDIGLTCPFVHHLLQVRCNDVSHKDLGV